jgi:outer membrane protein assembly complex protein YaeT
LLFLFLAALRLPAADALPASEASPSGTAAHHRAELKVRGLGWWDNYQARRTLALVLGEGRGETIDANTIEDATLILLSGVMEQGYLQVRVVVSGITTDGVPFSHELDSALTTTLPRPLATHAVTLRVITGRRYTLREVTFSGLENLNAPAGGGAAVITEKEAREFFMPSLGLFTPADARAFSPGKLDRGLLALRDTLRDRGYMEARTRVAGEQRDPETGEVRVQVAVEAGLLWRIGALQREAEGTDEPLQKVKLPATGTPWTRLVAQDIEVAARNAYYDVGYADARVTVGAKPEKDVAEDGARRVAVTVRAISGEEVHVSGVRFEGAGRTNEKLLRSKSPVRPGDPLDPQKVERARLRLSRLGVFDLVDSKTEPPDGPERDVVFLLREQSRWDMSLLFGYGSYEQLRGGIELRQNNLWGRAHRSRLELVQSMKSSQGDYTYSVPEFLGPDIDGSVKLFGLLREEESFDREEYGGSFLLRRMFRRWRVEATAGYTFESLGTRDNTLGTSTTDLVTSRAGSLNFTLVQDRRDNPLRPRRGWRWYLQMEDAAKWLGGDVEYERLKFDASWHAPLGGERWLHLGLTHGVVFGGDPVPVNKLFFPGGENSIRGYASGKAAPRDANGDYVGARSEVIANIELEQRVTGNWSAVVFLDALGMAADIGDYPLDETLFSVGAGVRYQTIIGPLRLEYGYNLNRRSGDPAGTVLFSLGFPF